MSSSALVALALVDEPPTLEGGDHGCCAPVRSTRSRASTRRTAPLTARFVNVAPAIGRIARWTARSSPSGRRSYCRSHGSGATYSGGSRNAVTSMRRTRPRGSTEMEQTLALGSDDVGVDIGAADDGAAAARHVARIDAPRYVLARQGGYRAALLFGQVDAIRGDRGAGGRSRPAPPPWRCRADHPRLRRPPGRAREPADRPRAAAQNAYPTLTLN